MNEPGRSASLLRNAHLGVDFEYPALLVAKELVFSVTIKDCTVQTFRCGGNGGQKVNKTSSGVRVIHPPSGAVGQSTDTRSQLQNKTLAFHRMAESGKFQAWLRLRGGAISPQDQVESDMDPANLLIMGREAGKWKIID